MVFGVTLQTLDRVGGNGITMVFVEAPDAECARAEARRIGEHRYQCVVLADRPVPCPGFEPTPTWTGMVDPVSSRASRPARRRVGRRAR